MFSYFFFFSSRRRHTRCLSDWSSDVCSSDLYAIVQHDKGGTYRSEDKGETWKKMGDTNPRPSYYSQIRIDPNNDLRIWELRSEERRVGKECRSRWSAYR